MINLAATSNLVFDHFTDSVFSLPDDFFQKRLMYPKKEYTFFLLKEGIKPKQISRFFKNQKIVHLDAKSISLNTENNETVKTDVYMYEDSGILRVFLFCRFKDDFDILRSSKKSCPHKRVISKKQDKIKPIEYDQILGIGA